MKFVNKKFLILLLSFFGFFLLATFAAYNNLIPHGLKSIPHYDAYGHFGMFGLFALLAHLAFNRRSTKLFGRRAYIGPTLIVVYALIDESLQSLSSNRTFDLMDIFWGVLGILTFIFVDWAIRNRVKIFSRYFYLELKSFVAKEARASFFAASFLFLIFASKYIHIFGLARYDFLFLAAIAIQIFMLAFKLETKDEAKTILLFHIIGFALEVYKTSPMVGSWSYPEAGYFKLWNVPLYSGFMYAAIGSYIAHAWKVLKLRLINPPKYILSVILCFFIYINFFTNHFIFDFRLLLLACIFILYLQTDIAFVPREREYKMPVTIGLMLVAGFVWVAENIGIFYGAWRYPSQIHAWQVVSLQKITPWFLMVIISFIIVAYLKHVKAGRKASLPK